jgi:hypothetical protein
MIWKAENANGDVLLPHTLEVQNSIFSVEWTDTFIQFFTGKTQQTNYVIIILEQRSLADKVTCF